MLWRKPVRALTLMWKDLVLFFVTVNKNGMQEHMSSVASEHGEGKMWVCGHKQLHTLVLEAGAR